MSRIPSLDGLRAIAISLVVMGRWAELRFQSNVAGSFASLGRRIFFVLSGYLITTLLMKEYGKTATIGIIVGADHRVWFTQYAGNALGAVLSPK